GCNRAGGIAGAWPASYGLDTRVRTCTWAYKMLVRHLWGTCCRNRRVCTLYESASAHRPTHSAWAEAAGPSSRLRRAPGAAESDLEKQSSYRHDSLKMALGARIKLDLSRW